MFPSQRPLSIVFGYTLHHDVSDRGGRGDNRLGNDWLIGKSHDTFAPLGPFIVPKESVTNPRNMSMRFAFNGETLQEGSTSQMIRLNSAQPPVVRGRS